MYAGKKKWGCGGKPKWLELDDGETYLKNILSRQLMFVFLMSVISLLMLVFVVAAIFGDLGEILMPMTIILGSFSTIGTSMGTHKLHLTNQRLVMEIKHKNAGEIRLDQIKAIQVTRKWIGGKLLVVPTLKGVRAIEVSLVKPYQLAEEIQQLSAANEDDSENHSFESAKGAAR